MIEDRNKNDLLDLEDLKIEKKNVDSKINNSIGAIRKIKKTIKHDTKKINSEKIKNENSIQNLKLNLEQNNKSAESLRKDLENSIQIKGSLTNELKSKIKEKDKIKDKIGTVKNRLDSSKDLKKLIMEHKSLEKEVKNMNLKLNQFHENFSALSAGLNELKQINQENIAPIEKNILDKEYEVLKDIDGMKENEKAIKDYTLRIKQAPSKLKSLDIQYKDQNRTKFKLELKLKESIRSLEMLKKRSEMFDSSMM
jgi:DNA repair exonuclease SbcCD ATPase subunit